MIFQVRVHFDVRSIHNHNFRWQITRASDLLQAPPGHPFDSFGCMSECVADRCKVRQILQHGVLLKPAVCHINLCIPHVLPLKNGRQTNAEATPVETESPDHSWTVRYSRSVSVLAAIRRRTQNPLLRRSCTANVPWVPAFLYTAFLRHRAASMLGVSLFITCLQLIKKCRKNQPSKTG